MNFREAEKTFRIARSTMHRSRMISRAPLLSKFLRKESGAAAFRQTALTRGQAVCRGERGGADAALPSTGKDFCRPRRRRKSCLKPVRYCCDARKVLQRCVDNASLSHSPGRWRNLHSQLQAARAHQNDTCSDFVANTYAEYLPRSAVISTREDRGGVDSDNLLHWAKKLTAYFRKLTVAGRKVVLNYDAYRSRMALRTLKHFEKNIVEFYALPAHTSGRTQLYDVVPFGSLR
eukprot:IDg2674t1